MDPSRLLGFRDEEGAVVNLAKELDPSKQYEVYLGAEDGSWSPKNDEVERIGELLKELGFSGGRLLIQKGKGGKAYRNKKGVVIVRFVEGVPKAPPKKEEAPIEEVPTDEEPVAAAARKKVVRKKAFKKISRK